MTGELTHVRVPHPRLVRRLRVCATALAVAITFVGAGHLAAWLSGFMAARSLSALIMKTNASVGLIATGVLVGLAGGALIAIPGPKQQSDLLRILFKYLPP